MTPRTQEAPGTAAAPGPSWLRLLILQPSPFCNVDCDYCYLPGRTLTHRMEMGTLRRIMEEVFATDVVSGDFSLIWHAGEPLAVPIRWYEEAFDLIDELTPAGVRIGHSFQSNGTLLNERWCDFIRERNVHIGLSIDGPAFIHDAHRRTRRGAGTHAQAMRGAQLLLDREIPFHVIAVVTRDSLAHADAIVDFFLEHGIRFVGFNIEELEGAHEATSLDDAPAGSVAAFYRRLYERQTACGEALRIREFDTALERILEGGCSTAAGTPNEQVVPYGIISVDWQGNFSSWSPELLGLPAAGYGDFNLGNVHAGGFLQATETEKFQRLAADIQAGVDQCRATCPYFGVCGGGAPANKFFENGRLDSTQTQYCRYATQVPVDLVLAGLESDLGLPRATAA